MYHDDLRFHFIFDKKIVCAIIFSRLTFSDCYSAFVAKFVSLSSFLPGGPVASVLVGLGKNLS